MRTEAAGAGYYESPWGKHPRLQILTVDELLQGRAIDMPPIRQVSRTFKKARCAKAKPPENTELPLGELDGEGIMEARPWRNPVPTPCHAAPVSCQLHQSLLGEPSRSPKSLNTGCYVCFVGVVILE